MNQKKLIGIVFIIITILFIISSITGIFLDIKYYILKRKILRHLHIYLSYVAFIFMVIHILQNKLWLKNNFAFWKKKAKKLKEMGLIIYLITINFILVNLTGISLHLKYIVLPHGMTKHLHKYTSYMLMILVLIHLYQNRTYIKNYFIKSR